MMTLTAAMLTASKKWRHLVTVCVALTMEERYKQTDLACSQLACSACHTFRRLDYCHGDAARLSPVTYPGFHFGV